MPCGMHTCSFSELVLHGPTTSGRPAITVGDMQVVETGPLASFSGTLDTGWGGGTDDFGLL